MKFYITKQQMHVNENFLTFFFMRYIFNSRLEIYRSAREIGKPREARISAFTCIYYVVVSYRASYHAVDKQW